MVKKNKQSIIERFKKYSPFIILFLIIFLGAYLRIWHIADYMTFLGDEGRDVLVVKRMIIDHKFTLLGPTASVGGFFLGPIYYYFMVPFLWLFRLDPVGPAVMVALFGTATIYLVYLLGLKLFNRHVGLFASLLYSLSPVVINYSRSSWNPNLVPFFTCLLIIYLLNYAKTNKPYYLIAIGAILGIGLQLHYLFLFLGVFTLLYLYIVAQKKEVKNMVFVLAGFLVLYSPFIIFELRHEFTNTRMILSFVFVSKDTGFELFNFIKTTLDVYFRIFTRLVVNNNTLFGVISVILSVITFLSLKLKERNIRMLILLWIFIPILLFGLYKKPIYDYYFGIIFPLPFILVSAGIFELFKNTRILKILSIIIFMAIVWTNWQSRPFLIQPNKQLAQSREVAKFIFDKAGNRPFNFALATAHNSDHAYRYFFEIWNNAPVTIENTTIDPQRKSVTKQLFVICELVECQPLGNSLWEIAGFGRADIEAHWKVIVLDIYKLVPYKGGT